MSHCGLYIILVNHFLKSTLNEDEFPTLSTDCPWTCPGVLWFWCTLFFHIFLFSIPLTRYTLGGKKDTLFTRFHLPRWCTGPQWDMPPPPPPRHRCRRREPLCPPKNFWKPEIQAKCGKNSGKIQAKCGGGKNKETTAKNSGKFTGREWKINCIFKSIKLFENNSQELARFYV